VSQASRSGQAAPPALGVPFVARMASRLEYKFIVPNGKLDELRRTIAPYVRLDAFSESRPDKQYTVRSVYYDSRRFECYQEKLEGFTFKKKFRIRGYDQPDDHSLVFLEIKRKREDFIYKSRARVRWSDIGSVFGGYGAAGRLPFEPGTAEAAAAGRFLYNYYRRRLVPVVLVAYEREAFYSRFEPALRLTFDKSIRSRLFPSLASLYQDRDALFILPGHFIFEVKFYMVLPMWVRATIRKLGLQRMAFSKYGTGIDAWRLEKKLLRGVGHTVEFPVTSPRAGQGLPN
jgi:hypothetical protein